MNSETEKKTKNQSIFVSCLVIFFFFFIIFSFLYLSIVYHSICHLLISFLVFIRLPSVVIAHSFGSIGFIFLNKNKKKIFEKKTGQRKDSGNKIWINTEYFVCLGCLAYCSFIFYFIFYEWPQIHNYCFCSICRWIWWQQQKKLSWHLFPWNLSWWEREIFCLIFLYQISHAFQSSIFVRFLFVFYSISYELSAVMSIGVCVWGRQQKKKCF